MELLFTNKDNKVELTRKDAMLIIGALKPLGTDFVEELENCIFGMRFFSLDSLSVDDFNTAYDLIMSADLHERTKEEIKQAFEADLRVKMSETA